jgi:hypothetical protein
MLVKVPLLAGFTSVATVPSGSLAKAVSVGAKTVNGPVFDKVSTRPAAFCKPSRLPQSYGICGAPDEI